MADSPASLEATVEVDAPVGDVWPLVADVTRIGEFSPECRKVVLLGSKEPAEGVRFVGINRRKLVTWPTTSRIVRFEPEHAIAWKVLESGATWTYELEPTESGTRIVERRELPAYSWLTKATGPLIGGAEGHDRDLQAGMHTTLARIKAVAEKA